MASTEMILKNGSEVSIESENFSAMRQDFNIAVQRMIENMMRSAEQAGSITLKVDISMRRERIRNTDPDLHAEEREIFIPSFSHKVVTQVTLKDERKGAVNPEMELVYDADGKRYMLRYVANTEQMSIFDKEFQARQEDPDPSDVWVNVETGEIAHAVPDGAVDQEETVADGFMNIPEEEDQTADAPDDEYPYTIPD